VKLEPHAAGPDPRLADAARALESMLLRQIVKASGAFKGGETAGSSVREGLFTDALADAVARAGGIGLAGQIVRSLGPAAGAASPVPGAPRPLPSPEPMPAGTGGVAAPGLPVTGHVTSGFGPRSDPFTGARADHHGVDVGAPEGTPIRAPAPGVVLRAGPRGGYGNEVEIDHGGGVVTVYGHASEVLVNPGQRIEAGQEIARVGSTGRSTGPHLHFEVRMGGQAVDPRRALKLYAARADGLLEEDQLSRRSP
jgi:murein DD-endopeptidase MepM/ murein hydrolase activator NlpD